MKTSLRLLFAATILCALTCLGFAQDIQPSAFSPQPSVAAPGPDIAAVKGPGGIPVAAIVSLAATVITAGVKIGFEKIGSKLNPAYIPFVALASSYALDWISHLTFGTESNWALALGAGLAAVGLNQVKKQLTPDPRAVG